MIRSILFLSMLIGLFAGCAHQKVENTPDAAAFTIRSHDDIKKALENDLTVNIVGKAENSKLGGIIQSPLHVVHCVDQHWPDAIEGEMIEVTGKLLVSTDYVAKQDETGAWSQGTAPGTSITIIQPCRYHILTTD